MGLYEELLEIDVLGPIAGILAPRPAWVDPDGTVHLSQKIVPGSPWIYVRKESERKCGKWLDVYFTYYKIIPKGCRCCWKVVWTGTTLDQLYQVWAIQKEMGLESKCGVEIRPRSGKLGRYQGFWYTSLGGGLDGGRELYKKVVAKFAKDKIVEGTELILKRGCTEIEQFFSPSDSWDKLAEGLAWDRKEKLMESILPDHASMAEGGALDVCSQLKWIEYAWEHGDSTVVEKYPNKYLAKPLMPQALQYQRSVHSGKDYIGWEGSSEPISLESSGDRSKIITEF